MGLNSIAINDTSKGVYKRINISADGKTLLGGILVGDAEQYNMLLQTVKNKVVLPPNPEDVILGSGGGEEAAGTGVTSLPDEALICSSVAEGGCETVDAIKKCTKAGTG